jgi:hypothetical protein
MESNRQPSGLNILEMFCAGNSRLLRVELSDVGRIFVLKNGEDTVGVYAEIINAIMAFDDLERTCEHRNQF